MRRRRGAGWTPVGALLWLSIAPFASEAQSPSQTRTFDLINRCGETIWIGITGASIGDLPGGLTLAPSPGGCSSFAEAGAAQACPLGQTCNVQTGQCSLVLDDVPADFSGRVWPMTGCAWQPNSDPVVCPTPGVDCCATGGCLTAGGGYGLDCAQSGQSPSTVAELTLLTIGQDTYDVSLVDGFNVPVEIRPGPGAAAVPTGQSAAYWCGNPGGTKPLTSLPACTWNAVLDSSCSGNPALRAVDATLCSSTPCPGSSTCNSQDVCTCTADSDCGPGLICGVGNPSYIGFLTCGTFVGCAAPKDLCAAYFTGGQSCSQAGDCISGNCQMPCPTGGSGCCAPPTPSAFGALGCNQTYPATQPSCKTQADCPFVSSLPGSPWTGTSSAACVDCPSPTTCQPVPNTDSTQWQCQEPCQDGVCVGIA